jgi:exodeoxyribonuclease VII large subunit
MVKVAVEANLPGRLSIAGEISSYRPNSSGHNYFTIKDEQCQIPAVMWKSTAAKSKFQFANGIAVIATGYVDVYPPFGKYQFIVDTINPAGVGDLRLMFERLVARLEEEGLFDPEHKKPLPRYPMRIGIVTSATGAAVHDITDSINSRFSCAKLMLYPVPVQGKGAEVKIAGAIDDINARNEELKLDLLIVGRGGGSLEDLWCFNEEIVARAIFNSRIPVISAVGHEIDTTIADLVADARASTPTRAGVIAVPDMAELNDQIDAIERRLRHDVTNKITFSRQRLATILASAAFRNPGYIAGMKSQILDELQWRMKDAFKDKLSNAKFALETSVKKVEAIEPHRLLGQKNLDLERFESRLAAAFNAAINSSRLKLAQTQGRLQSLDPRSVLKRGYSITRRDDGSIIIDPDKLIKGDVLTSEFAAGKKIKSTVQ